MAINTSKTGFSIVIPTYNRRKPVVRAIESIINQTYTNWEAIVIDNISNDGTKAALTPYLDKYPIIFVENTVRNPALSRNIGIRMSRFEYIAFLDSDDYWDAQKLEHTYEAISKYKANCIYHDLHTFKVEGNKQILKRRLRSRQLKNNYFCDLFLNGNAINTSSLTIKKSLLVSIDGFCEDARIRGVEDYFAWLEIARINSCKFKPYKIDKTLGFYELSSDSITTGPNRIRAYQYLIEYYGNICTIMPSHFYSHLALQLLNKQDYSAAIDNCINALWAAFHPVFFMKTLYILTFSIFMLSCRNLVWRFRDFI